MIYTPQVPVFRDDHGELLDTPYLVDFATSPAPNCGVMMKAGRDAEKRAAEVMQERSERVLQLFAQAGAVDIVLGAWGCGVFRNDPETVAKIFKQHLDGKFRGCFRKVLFAITDPKMAAVFESVLWKSLRLCPSGEGQPAPAADASRTCTATTHAAKTVASAGEDAELDEGRPLQSDEKQFFRATKLLREILKLEERTHAGDRLKVQQRAKLERKQETIAKLAALAKALPADSPAREKDADVWKLIADA